MGHLIRIKADAETPMGPESQDKIRHIVWHALDSVRGIAVSSVDIEYEEG